MTGRRPLHPDACRRCGKNPRICVCNEARAIPTRSSLVVYQHEFETRRPSNTAVLVAACVPGTDLIVRGDPAGERRLQELVSAHAPHAYVIFPEEDAKTLEELPCGAAGPGGPSPLFVLLDGSWRQAHRMRRRCPVLAGLVSVRLEPGAPSRYLLRRQSHSNRVSTAEAAAWLLAGIEGDPDRGAPLLELLDLMVERSFALKGRDREGALAG